MRKDIIIEGTGTYAGKVVYVDRKTCEVSNTSDNNVEKLTPQSMNVLLCAIRKYPYGKVTYKDLCRVCPEWKEQEETSKVSTIRQVYRRIGEQLGLPRVLKKDGHDGKKADYIWNPAVIGNLTVNSDRFFLYNAESLFDSPEGYIEPSEVLAELKKEAFTGGKTVHIISGEHGVGKSTIARQFASLISSESILFTSYDETLEKTVAKLKMENGTDSYTFSEKIAMLRELVSADECSLLVIDDYNSEHFKEELGKDNRQYLDLLSTGIRILITTNYDMKNVYMARQTVMEPFDPGRLVEMFRGLCVPEKYDDGKARKLIADYLSNNTYLVRLAAALTEYCTIEEIIASFETEDKNTPIYIKRLEGKDDEEITSLYSHYLKLFNLARITENSDACRILVNLAAMPARGLPFKMFEDLAFPEEEKDRLRSALHRLHNNYWVTRQNGCWLLHPMIRKIVVEEIEFHPEDVSFLLKELSRKMSLIVTYNDSFPDCLDSAFSLYNLLKHKKVGENIDLTILKAEIISLCDIISLTDEIRLLKDEAYDGLMKLDCQSDSVDDLLLYARSMNHVGWALLRIVADEKEEKRNKEDLEKAEKILTAADRMLKGKEKKSERIWILRSKIKGNLGDYYGLIDDWSTMFKMNKENLNVRKNAPCIETQERNMLCGASLNGMAMAKFNLANDAARNNLKAKTLKLLEESKSYYLKAKECYRETDAELEKALTEICLARTLYEYVCRLDEGQKHTEDIVQSIQEELSALDYFLDYLNDMEKKNIRKITDCQNMISQLVDLAISLKCPVSIDFLDSLKTKAGWAKNPFICPNSSVPERDRISVIMNSIDEWLSRKEFAELLNSFSIVYDPNYDIENKIEFLNGNNFKQLWRRRVLDSNRTVSNQDLDKIENSLSPETKQIIYAAARSLGLAGVHESRFEKVNYILPFGGYGISNLKRCELAHREYVRTGKNSKVVALASGRKICDSEMNDIAAFAPRAKTESETMLEGMKEAFSCHENGKKDAQLVYLETDLDDSNFCTLSFPHTDKKDNTVANDALDSFFSCFKPKERVKIICCTDQLYCVRQQIISLKYALKNIIEIDTIGFTTREKNRAVDYLLEIRKTVEEIISLYEMMNELLLEITIG